MSAIDKIINLCKVEMVGEEDGKNTLWNKKWKASFLEDGTLEVDFLDGLDTYYLYVPMYDVEAIRNGDKISDDLEEEIADIYLYTRATVLTILESIITFPF